MPLIRALTCIFLFLLLNKAKTASVYEAAAVFEIFSESIPSSLYLNYDQSGEQTSFTQSVEVPAVAIQTTSTFLEDYTTSTAIIDETTQETGATSTSTASIFHDTSTASEAIVISSTSSVTFDYEIPSTFIVSTTTPAVHDSETIINSTSSMTSSTSAADSTTTSLLLFSSSSTSSSSSFSTSTTIVSSSTPPPMIAPVMLTLKFVMFASETLEIPSVVPNVTAISSNNAEEQEVPSEPPDTCKLTPVSNTNQSNVSDIEVQLPDFCIQGVGKTCQYCIEGFAVNLQNNTCVRCQPGKYRTSRDDAETCTPCEVGKSTLGLRGQAKCYACEVNESTHGLRGQATCFDCSVLGAFTDARGTAACRCLRGTGLDVLGSRCVPCMAGYVDEGLVSELIVLLDSDVSAYKYAYPNVFLPQQCQPCPAGTYSTSAGTFACTACDAGKYISPALRGSTECALCPLNTYTNHTSSKAGCSACYAHGYTLAMGSTGPCLCEVGYVLVTRTLALPNGYNETYFYECEACPAGKYEAETDWCQECEVGQYAIGEGNTACSLCKLGTYSDVTGQTSASCIPCDSQDPEGLTMSTWYEGAEEPGACFCKPGFSTTNLDEGRCIPCTSGTYALNRNSNRCTNCAPGTYSTASARASLCDDCEIGFYNPHQGKSECLSCTSIGMSNATLKKKSTKITDCICMPGSSWSFDNTRCAPCTAGYANPLSNSQCSGCLRGYFTNESGQSACRACALGSFNPDTSKSSCRSCENGTSTVQIASQTPQDCLCAMGMAFDDDTQHCEHCAGGTYQPFMKNGSQCLACGKGTFSSGMGMTSALVCEACPLGKFNAEAGRSYCVDCDSEGLAFTLQPGSQNSSNCICGRGKTWDFLRTKCVACRNGTYQPELDGSNCLACGKGMFSSGTGITSALACEACPLGKYNAEAGMGFCVDCDSEGMALTLQTGSQNSYDCICGRGKTWDFSRTKCVACRNGTYQPELDGSNCLACGKGTFSTGMDMTSALACEACPLGKFNAEAGRGFCVDCDSEGIAVTLQTGSQNSSDCICGRGKTWDFLRTKCATCGNGTYQPKLDGSNCLACGKGTFSTGMGMTSALACEACPLGKFNEEAGKGFCVDCDSEGIAVTLQTGSQNSSDCICGRGKTWDFLRTKCVACRNGTYQPELDGANCLACDKGTFSSGMGMTSALACEACPLGKFNAEAGRDFCVDCDSEGMSLTLQTGSQNSSDCICGRGKTWDFLRTKCVACGNGTYQPELDGANCLACGKGTFSSGMGMTSAFVCEACPMGKYNPEVAQTLCLNCDSEGTAVTPNTGSQSKAECACGKGFAWDVTKTRCAPCIPGTYQPLHAGGDTCIPCELGKYSNVSAQGEDCYACPFGTYNPGLGQLECRKCDENDKASTLLEGRTSLEDCVCDPGYIYDQNISSVCVECPAGTYEPLANASHCLSCPLGTFSTARGLAHVTQCGFCDVGSYSASENATACVFCPLHTSTNNRLGSSACEPCSPHSEAMAYGSAWCTCVRGAIPKSQAADFILECVLCAPGTYYLNNSCIECEPGKYSHRPGQLDHCFECEQDKFTLASALGSTACVDCAANAGTRNQTGAIKCWCHPGFALDFLGTRCAPCLRGHQSWLSDEDLEYKCTACFPGTYAASAPSSTCTQCPNGTYSESSMASTACLACPNRSIPTSQQTSCVCPLLHYNDSTDASWSCEPCTLDCDPVEFLISACTATQNTVCRPCSQTCSLPNRYIWRNCTRTRDIDCRACSSSCGTGWYVARECSLYKNVRCAPCTVRCPSPLHYVKKTCTSMGGDLECELCPSGSFPDLNMNRMRCMSCLLGYATLPVDWDTTSNPCVLCSLQSTSMMTSANKSACVSRCDAGQYRLKGFTSVSGQQVEYWFCEFCPPGSFGLDGVSCQECDPWSSCSSSHGMTTCTACSSAESLPGVQYPSGILPEDVCLASI